jgi:hypothetical protein
MGRPGHGVLFERHTPIGGITTTPSLTHIPFIKPPQLLQSLVSHGNLPFYQLLVAAMPVTPPFVTDRFSNRLSVDGGIGLERSK